MGYKPKSLDDINSLYDTEISATKAIEQGRSKVKDETPQIKINFGENPESPSFEQTQSPDSVPDISSAVNSFINSLQAPVQSEKPSRIQNPVYRGAQQPAAQQKGKRPGVQAPRTGVQPVDNQKAPTGNTRGRGNGAPTGSERLFSAPDAPTVLNGGPNYAQQKAAAEEARRQAAERAAKKREESKKRPIGGRRGPGAEIDDLMKDYGRIMGDEDTKHGKGKRHKTKPEQSSTAPKKAYEEVPYETPAASQRSGFQGLYDSAVSGLSDEERNRSAAPVRQSNFGGMFDGTDMETLPYSAKELIYNERRRYAQLSRETQAEYDRRRAEDFARAEAESELLRAEQERIRAEQEERIRRAEEERIAREYELQQRQAELDRQRQEELRKRDEENKRLRQEMDRLLAEQAEIKRQAEFRQAEEARAVEEAKRAEEMQKAEEARLAEIEQQRLERERLEAEQLEKERAAEEEAERLRLEKIAEKEAKKAAKKAAKQKHKEVPAEEIIEEPSAEPIDEPAEEIFTEPDEKSEVADEKPAKTKTVKSSSAGKKVLRGILSLVLIVLLVVCGGLACVKYVLKVDSGESSLLANTYFFTSTESVEDTDISKGDIIIARGSNKAETEQTVVYTEDGTFKFGKKADVSSDEEGSTFYTLSDGTSINREAVIAIAYGTLPAVGTYISAISGILDYVIIGLGALCLLLLLIILIALRSRKVQLADDENTETSEESEEAETDIPSEAEEDEPEVQEEANDDEPVDEPAEEVIEEIVEAPAKPMNKKQSKKAKAKAKRQAAKERARAQREAEEQLDDLYDITDLYDSDDEEPIAEEETIIPEEPELEVPDIADFTEESVDEAEPVQEEAPAEDFVSAFDEPEEVEEDVAETENFTPMFDEAEEAAPEISEPEDFTPVFDETPEKTEPVAEEVVDIPSHDEALNEDDEWYDYDPIDRTTFKFEDVFSSEETPEESEESVDDTDSPFLAPDDDFDIDELFSQL